MGCATSKLDDLPAVALCRERCAFLDEAIRQRFAFAEAHVAYLHSLKAVGLSLDRFFNQDLESSVHGPHSPVLNLPAQRKGDPDAPGPSGSPPEKIHHHLHSHSDSGSHLNFHSDDDDSEGEDGSGSESLHHDHHDASSPVHQSYGGYYSGYGYENLNLNLPGADGGAVYRSVNYMKNQATPSVIYTQQQVRTETMQMGETSAASSSYNPHPNCTDNKKYVFNLISDHNSHNFSGNNFNSYPNRGFGGEFIGGSQPPAAPPPAMASRPEAPSPLPSPRSTPWEFLNSFESFEKYYPAYTSSRDSREVREEEGIPDLEDEYDEVVKELHVDQKFADGRRSSISKPGVSDEDGGADAIDAQMHYKEPRPSDPVEYEVHVVDKKVVDVETRSKDQDNAAGLNPRRGFKGNADVAKEIHHHLHSHSDSGSHLNFHSADDDSEDEDGSGWESLHHDHHDHSGYGYENLNLNLPGAGGVGVYRSVNYMKNQATPSVIYTQQQVRTETMQMGETSAASSSYNPYPNYTDNKNYASYPISYHDSHNFSGNNFNSYPNHGFGGDFFGGSQRPAAPPPAMASRTEAPPPSPPRSSPWEFLNPFESVEKYYPAYTSSRDSREVREEEGIPDLEDEYDEVVKELHVDQKFADSGRSSISKPGVSDEDGRADAIDAQIQYKEARPSDPMEYEVHMVDKKVVDMEARSKDQDNATGLNPRRGFKGDADVVKEIQAQFKRASESETGLAEFLEIGKVQYKGKHGVSSKLLHLPVMSSPKRFSDADSAILDCDQELELRSKKLSSTLHKLYLWEKKLYEEVKAEEKMRLLHEQKSRRLKSLDERGAENQKIHATRTLVRSISAKIRIAIQVVDRISVKINSLRDDELWPQLLEFIQGLTRMWKSMLECHHSQCQAIVEAKRLDAIAFRNNDAHFEATRQLEHDLINWTQMFSSWVGAQKGYVRALNNWLMKCLFYVPEETADGRVPFSPGRIGAPPVFVVCFQWWQSLERISEKEVIDRMRDFASNVLHLWDRDKAEMRQRMLASKDEQRIRSLDKEDQKIHKKIQALEKGIVVNSGDENGMGLAGHVVYQAETSKGGSLQASLQHVLEALERFTGNLLKVYEELLQRIEEDHLAVQHERVS